jgi:hypothetical protein
MARTRVPMRSCRAVLRQPRDRGIRQQRAEVCARQQQVRTTAAAEERIAQHAQEHFAA